MDTRVATVTLLSLVLWSASANATGFANPLSPMGSVVKGFTAGGHIGTDYDADQPDNVYAIADGQVYWYNGSAGGYGGGGGASCPAVDGVVLFVRHRKANGDYFIAQYGHIQNVPTYLQQTTQTFAGPAVQRGEKIGEIAVFAPCRDCTPRCDHLHLGIWDSQNGIPSSNWGYGTACYSNPSGCWVDPVAFLQNESPYGTYTAACAAQTPTDPSGVLHLQVNEVVNCSFTFSNTGSAYWTNDGNSSHYVELHSVNSSWSQDQASSLAWNWLTGSNVKIATASTGTVDPGAQGTFNFTIKTPATAGSYTLYVALYHPNTATYMAAASQAKIEISVAAPPPPPPAYTMFAGKFDQGSTNDVGLYEAVSGNWMVAYADVSNNRFVPAANQWLTNWGAGVGAYRLLPGDFSGDGYTDICLYHQETGRWFVAYNQGWNQFVPIAGPQGNPNGSWLSGWAQGDGDDWVPFTGDFSGDGSNDVGAYYPASGRWFIAFNQGGRFEQANGPAGNPNGCWLDGWGIGSYGDYRPMIADFSGDGVADVCLYHPATGRWFVAHTQHSPTYYLQPVYGIWLDGWAVENGTLQWRAFAGKSSVDNYADVIAYTPYYGRWFVAWNWGDHFAQANGPYNGAWLDNWAKTEGSTTYQARAADVSGDGYLDLIAYAPSVGRWFVAYNWGTHFAQASGQGTNGAWLDNWGTSSSGGVDPFSIQPAEPEREALSLRLWSTPNPTAGRLVISYTLPSPMPVRLAVYDLAGKRVALLVDGSESAGDHHVPWDAAGLSPGVYFYQLTAGSTQVRGRTVLLK